MPTPKTIALSPRDRRGILFTADQGKASRPEWHTEKRTLPPYTQSNARTWRRSPSSSTRTLCGPTPITLSGNQEPDPMSAYAGSGYAGKIVAERVGGQQAGWGA